MDRVVVLGGGFAGVACARELRRGAPAGELEVVLLDRENHMVFHPLLAEVAGGSIDPQAVAAPLRQMLPGVRCRSEEVVRIDLEGRTVSVRAWDGGTAELGWDRLVVACGSVVDLARVPGMADHAFPLRTVGDALRLRSRVMQQLERAEVCDDAERRRFLLSFVVVGGGFSGVEVAGEINDLLRSSVRFFGSVAPGDPSVTLVHSRDEILPEVGRELRVVARERMERAGVRFATPRRVRLATGEGVVLDDGSAIRGATVVCTVGNGPAPAIEKLEVAKEGGRIATEPDMRIAGTERAWAIGDCAVVPNAATGTRTPATAQFAVRQGRQCAANVLRALRGEPGRPFSFVPRGQLCAIGHRNAVGEVLGRRLSGFPAWFLWRTVYLWKVPTWARRLRVAFDWTWDLVFPRDLWHLRTDETERVSTAYFPAGAFVFRQGDPATCFYAIRSGEVEIVLENGGAPPTVVTALGAGSYFGEMALVDDGPRSAGVRARTDVEVVVIGRRVFDRISESLGPLRETIAAAAEERRRELAALTGRSPAI